MNKALEHILQSSLLNVQHDLRSSMPSGRLFQGASFERLGKHAGDLNFALATTPRDLVASNDQLR